MQIDDFSSITYAPYIHGDKSVLSIGWLGNAVPTNAMVSDEVMSILRHYADKHSASDGELGRHTCEICESMGAYDRKELAKNGSFHGEIWIEIDNVRYVLPQAIFHYIEEHNYSPPQRFLGMLLAHWASSDSEACRSGSCVNEKDLQDERARALSVKSEKNVFQKFIKLFKKQV